MLVKLIMLVYKEANFLYKAATFVRLLFTIN